MSQNLRWLEGDLPHVDLISFHFYQKKRSTEECYSTSTDDQLFYGDTAYIINVHLHLHLGHLADASIQSDLQ